MTINTQEITQLPGCLSNKNPWAYKLLVPHPPTDFRDSVLFFGFLVLNGFLF